MAINPFLSVSSSSCLAGMPGSPLAEPVASVGRAGTAPQQHRADTAALGQFRQEPGEAIAEINASLTAWSTNLRFDVDPDLNRLVVSVIDPDSGEVLRTIPNEVVMRIAKFAAGLQGKLVDTAA